jgi:hypothetical protein
MSGVPKATKRKCNLCGVVGKEGPGDSEFYARRSGRLAAYCRACDRKRKRSYDRGPGLRPRKEIPTAKAAMAERDLTAEREAAEARAREERAKRALVDEVRELRARQAFIDCLAADARPPKVVAREKSGTREMAAVILASDWHVEEVVDPESVAGRNKYDLGIADQRIERFFQAVAWHVEHQRASGKIAVRDMVLWLGGDMMSGYIHEELLESNELSPTETILWLTPRLVGGIEMLLDRLDLTSLTIPCSHGNHGRTTQKKRVSTAYANSFEWLMYHQIAWRFERDERVRFEVTNSAHQYAEVYGFKLHFHHGDELNYAGGVGGLGIPFLKAVPAWDAVRKADYHCIGHWHQLRDYGSGVSNGSLIGYAPYSLKIRAPFEPPQQAMFYVDSKRGVTMHTKLWVAEREGAEKGGKR